MQNFDIFCNVKLIIYGMFLVLRAGVLFVYWLTEQINGESVTSVSQKDAVSLVKRMGNSVKLTVWR